MRLYCILISQVYDDLFNPALVDVVTSSWIERLPMGWCHLLRFMPFERSDLPCTIKNHCLYHKRPAYI